MAENTSIIKNFENFKGLDLLSSPLTRDPNYSLKLTNWHFGEGGSIEGRPGIQIFGERGGFTKVHKYTYASRETGGTIEELLAVNDHLWKLGTYYLRITRVGGSTDWGYRVFLDTSTATFKFELRQAGVTLLSQDLGTGLEATPYTVNALSSAVDALTNFTCSVVDSTSTQVKVFIVDGNQSSVNTITTDSGHTYVVGDIIKFWDHLLGKLTFRKVSAKTSTTITFLGTSVSVVDNQIGGVLNVEAASIPITNGWISPSTSSKDVSFGSWDPVYMEMQGSELGNGPFKLNWANRLNDSYSSPSFVNFDDHCFIAAGISNIPPRTNPYGYAYAYDSQNIQRVGVPTPASIYTFLSGSSGNLTGSYQYGVTTVMIDIFGVERESNIILSDPLTTLNESIDVVAEHPVIDYGVDRSSSIVAVTSGTGLAVNAITIASNTGIKAGDWIAFNDQFDIVQHREVSSVSSTTINILGESVSYLDSSYIRPSRQGWNLRYAKIASTTSNVSSVTVDSSNTLLPGDRVFIFDTNTKKVKSVILSSSVGATISWDPTLYGTVSVLAGDYISPFKYRLYRTFESGADLFFLMERPLIPFIALEKVDLDITKAIAKPDNTLDEELGYQYIYPPDLDEHDVPERAAYLTSHQGCLIYTGGLENPNTIGISLPGEGHFTPLSSRYLDIPSSISGPITAIASDSDDRLTTLKSNSYYDLAGDVTTPGAVSIREITAGDYGVSSHASLAKAKGLLVGVGPLGFVGIKNGALMTEGGLFTRSAILRNKDINLGKAISFNSSILGHFISYIPGLTNANNALCFISDYSREGQWFDWSFQENMEPSGGFAEYGNSLYHLCLTNGQCFRWLKEEELGAYAFNDNHLPIAHPTQFQWIHLNEPSIDKQIIQVGIFSMVSPYETFIPFSLTCATYRDFDLSTPDSEFSLSFPAISKFYDAKDLDESACKSLLLSLTSTAYNQRPKITGIEYVVRGTYDVDSIQI